MKKIAATVVLLITFGGGAYLGWELKQWHTMISEWGDKAAVFDYVGAENMQKVILIIEQQRQQQKQKAPRQPAPAQKIYTIT